MAPRGLSADEKRVKLLELFHETKDFYQLKELEKLAPKMKGIVSQSVKEVLQLLVDDGLVQGDKIGSSNCNLLELSISPRRSGVLNAARFIGRVNAAKETKASLSAQLSEIQQSIDKEKSMRAESETRTMSLAKLQSLKKELASLDDELLAYGACDPTKIEETKRAITLGKEAAIRWTENYLALLSHFTRTTQVSAEEIRKYLEIDEEYEDIC